MSAAEPPSRIRLAAFSGGASVPSARLRVHQLATPLAERRIDLTQFDAHSSSYPPDGGVGARSRWIAGEVAQRASQVIRARRQEFDGSLVHREFISTVPTLESLVPAPIVFDVDDAIWLLRHGLAARHLASRSSLILAGNRFLADYFSAYAPVHIVPTAVDVSRYRPQVTPTRKARIGWCGMSSGFRYLTLIEEALRRTLAEHADVEFAIMSNSPPPLDLPTEQVRFFPWSESGEPAFLNSLTIGVMPLEDGTWERGKCAYKMLTYMACAVPVVVSPVGMNAELLGEADVGLGASGTDGWCHALAALLGDQSLREALGRRGRTLVEQHYGVDPVSDRVAQAIRTVVA